ncbi:hypothetical protein B0H63DRAFT_275147 [Podospora didyma]|uniref:Uncharacterized protein n=1 Tax=Podospora didyma TaxID=330526 RepID=A0AAE0KG00_9PEZI|nr:hypothetical protein B0H63DRAFT_275147 [Podospora didyma]
MASFAATACRISSRLARQTLLQDAAVRGFRTSAAALAAQNLTMPALSPTMTEGNIASWRVKEGDKFLAGDVLLEIETDKATMDVEAQDDGILMKIMKGDSSKGVPVGTRIAVIAEEGDDISALEIPPDEGLQTQEAKSDPPAASSSSSSPSSETAPPKPSASDGASKPAGGKAPKQTYPLYPSVAHLLKQNGLDKSAIGDMTPTGPNGRLLKGDVLAFLGKINAKTPAEVSSRFEKASHLDLSNIKVAKAPEAKAAEKSAAPAALVPEVPSVVSLPVSLAAVIEVQKKVQNTLGVFLPISTFIARATDVANDELPLPAGATPSADELFNQVLGLDKIGSSRGSRGCYNPQIAALSQAASYLTSGRPLSGKRPDIIDMLSGSSRGTTKQKPTRPLTPGLSTGPNLFSLRVPRAEEKRAQVFLERVKLVLEKEPGRLVL